MLSLNKINVDIGPVGILKKASLSLSQGEMVGLIAVSYTHLTLPTTLTV